MSWEAIFDTIRSRFNTEITVAETLTTAWDNAPFTGNADQTQSWCRFTIIPGESETTTIGTAQKRVRMLGVAIAQVFTPIDVGDEQGWQLADKIRAKFTNVRLTNGIIFRTPSARVVRAESGNYWQINVVCPFQADTLV